MTFRRVTFSSLRASNGFGQLIHDYVEEFKHDAPGAPLPSIQGYLAAEEKGELRCIGDFKYPDDELIGCVILSVMKSRHYPKPLVTVDSLFLKQRYRKGSEGLRLLSEATKLARDVGAEGLCMSAIPGTSLDRLLDRRGATLARKVYFLPLPEEQGVSDDES